MSSNQVQLIQNKREVIDLLKYENKDSVVWWNPVNDTIVKGSARDEQNREIPSDHVILNLKPHFAAKKEYKAQKRSWEDYITKGYSQEFEDSAYLLHEQLDQSKQQNKNLLNATVIRPEHFAALQTSTISEIIIAIQNKQHNLLQTVKTINSDKLNPHQIMEIGDQDKLVTRNIGEEGLPTEIQPYKWRNYQIGLQLNGTKATFAGTLDITAFDMDVKAPFVRIMENAITEDKHKMISEILNGTGFTSTPIATDWDTLDANGRPTAKAYQDIGALKTQIANSNRGTANWIASQQGPFDIYNDNSALLGTVATGPYEQNTYTETNFIARNIQRLSGMQWVVDNLIDPDNVIVYADEAIYFNQGPRRSSTTTNPITGNNGVVNLEYYAAKLIFADMIKRYTAVST